MKKKASVNLSTKEVKNALACARDNAIRIARKNCDDYIKWNPQDKERRERDLDIEICGISNLYYKMIEEMERAEKISRSTEIVY